MNSLDTLKELMVKSSRADILEFIEKYGYGDLLNPERYVTLAIKQNVDELRKLYISIRNEVGKSEMEEEQISRKEYAEEAHELLNKLSGLREEIEPYIEEKRLSSLYQVVDGEVTDIVLNELSIGTLLNSDETLKAYFEDIAYVNQLVKTLIDDEDVMDMKTFKELNEEDFVNLDDVYRILQFDIPKNLDIAISKLSTARTNPTRLDLEYFEETFSQNLVNWYKFFMEL